MFSILFKSEFCINNVLEPVIYHFEIERSLQYTKQSNASKTVRYLLPTFNFITDGSRLIASITKMFQMN